MREVLIYGARLIGQVGHQATIAILKKVPSGHIKKGYQIPSLKYGAGSLNEMEGYEIKNIPGS